VHPTENGPRDEEDGRKAVFGAIPARYGSTRLPAKALVELAGRPMIEHVWRRACSAPGLQRIVVLTDDERIADVVRGFGGEVEMTPESCASGTDRGRIARHLVEHPEDPIVTLAADAEPTDGADPAAVQVVLDRAGYALYFSRSQIPFPRTPGAASPLRHLGIYGYRREALLRIAELEPTPLERAESLEQLRALEHGVRIRVLTGARPSRGVDTAEDAAAVADHLHQMSLTGEES
jgi:3-deoxy-manno-octulosonate cytidylyltransferase (CMP-KDO synthetase)